MKDKFSEIQSYLTGSNQRITILYVLSSIFIGLNCYLIYHDIYWLLFLPPFLVILYLYFFSLDKILLLITALTPVAVNITQFEFNVGISIPSEPLMLGVLLVFVDAYHEHYQRFAVGFIQAPVGQAVVCDPFLPVGNSPLQKACKY